MIQLHQKEKKYKFSQTKPSKTILLVYRQFNKKF